MAEAKNIIGSLLDLGNYLIINKELAKSLGIIETVLLMKYIELDRMIKKPMFYQTRSQIENALGIPAKKQQRIDEKLKNLGLIFYIRKGIPPKNHYRINYDNILEYIDQLGKSGVNDERDQLGQNVGINSNEENLEENKRDQLGQNVGIETDILRPQEKNINNKHNSFKKELTDSTSCNTERTKLKRRKKQNIKKEDDTPTSSCSASSVASKLRKKAKEAYSQSPCKSESATATSSCNTPKFYIPTRTLKAIEYWKKQSCTPNLRVNPDNPTKALKNTVKVLGQFFSGKLFLSGVAYLPSNLSSAERKELSTWNTLDDFKDLVDTWEDRVVGNEFVLNATFSKGVSLIEFLIGNPQRGKQGMYSQLVCSCYWEPKKLEKKEDEHYPRITRDLIEVWENYGGIFHEDEKDLFVKAANSLPDLLEYRERKRPYCSKLSATGKYCTEAYLVACVLDNNKNFIQDKSPKPSILLGPWFREQVLEV